MVDGAVGLTGQNVLPRVVQASRQSLDSASTLSTKVEVQVAKVKILWLKVV